MEKSQDNKPKLARFNKTDANRKTSILFTQLGLVLALLITYIAIESKVIVNDVTAGIPVNPFPIDDTFIPDTTPEKVKPIEPQRQVIPEPAPHDFDLIDEKSDTEESDILFTSETDNNEPQRKIDYRSFEEVNVKEKIIEDVSIYLVEEMPVFPGCKGNKEELRVCLSKEIGRIVRRNFNPDIAQDIGLNYGEKKMYVTFVIDKNGMVSNIKTKAPHVSLKKEVIRVINKIPKITPGKFKGKDVGVKYSLPINYMVVE